MVKKIFLFILAYSSLAWPTVYFQVTLLKERVSREEWLKNRDAFEIQFQRPAKQPAINLADLSEEQFRVNFDAYNFATHVYFKYEIDASLLSSVPFFEVMLVNLYDEYPQSSRKRFNLLTDAYVKFEIKRKSQRCTIKILNSDLKKISINYDGKTYNKGEVNILGDLESDRIRRLSVRADGYRHWENDLYEGRLLKEKELFILLIPQINYHQFERGVYLFQLGYLDEAMSIFQKIRLDLPEWGYGYYYVAMIDYLKQGSLSDQDLTDLEQALSFAHYERNFLLMAEINYLLARNFLKQNNFIKAKLAAEEGAQYIRDELAMFKDGRFKLYFANYDLAVDLDFTAVSAEIRDFGSRYAGLDLPTAKMKLNQKLFDVSQRLKRIRWTDNGLMQEQKYEREIVILRAIIRSKK